MSSYRCLKSLGAVWCSRFVTRSYSTEYLQPSVRQSWAGNSALSEKELDRIERNVMLRQHKNNVPLLRSLVKKLQMFNDELNSDLQLQLQNELIRLPNATHERLLEYGDEPRELFMHKPAQQLDEVKHFEEFSKICKALNLLRTEHLGNFTGHKSYYLIGPLARLEQAIIQYTVDALKEQKFGLVSVPDILPGTIIEGCGMQIEGDRTQVYKLDSGQCLSGTSEMALAGFFKDMVLDEADLPLKMASVSRCYRAETSAVHEEKGIYRVHQFTKVEMFAVCNEEQSEPVLESFKDFEIALFEKLGLHFRLLDMPPCELGAPAYQKYDIEAWMPGRQMWGEISSCSNCTDYQAQRLNIRYKKEDNQLRFVHTVNGTAAAIPRLLISIVETNQTVRDSVVIPNVLQKYFPKAEIVKNKNFPELKLVKSINPQLVC